jgi:uncharacterized repeat protein (TIGR01451 family)
MTCTASGTAAQGQYANLGSVVASPPAGPPVEDSDPSHYLGVTPSIDIEKSTNGVDADTPTGPEIEVGQAVTWEYIVTNTGGTELTGIQVTDDQGVTVACPADTLAAGASMTCTANGTAAAGQYANIGSVVASPPAGPPVNDSDPSHYLGVTPSIDIEKTTNGVDADTPTGPVIEVGQAVTWEYLVTNTGETVLTNIQVTDDQGVTVTCPGDTLAAGASMTCSASGTAAPGQYANIGSVAGKPPVGPTVEDSDPSHYLGVTPSIDIEKLTNGSDADTPTGPAIEVGQSVLWEYIVTNTGETSLSNIQVTDDQGVAVSCPGDTLAAGASMTCTASGTAASGQYANIGSVAGKPPVSPPVEDSDPSHYIGVTPSIDIEKTTNGVDADTPTGPEIEVGQAVTWEYIVTNTGETTLDSIVVSDDQGVTVTCPGDTLAPGASMTCTAVGTAAPRRSRIPTRAITSVSRLRSISRKPPTARTPIHPPAPKSRSARG